MDKHGVDGRTEDVLWTPRVRTSP